jgi:diketogulonate reductase-like aldo/keto reductase
MSKSFTRIIENFGVWDFTLDDEDMRAMSDLNVGWRHLIWSETSLHPDYPYKEDLPWDYKVTKPGKGSTAGAK